MNINDLVVRVNASESNVMNLRKELECCKHANANSIDVNSNLQTQVSSLNNHISVVTGQNAELTRELTAFADANEALRHRLDRRARVCEVRERNDAHLAAS